MSDSRPPSEEPDTTDSAVEHAPADDSAVEHAPAEHEPPPELAERRDFLARGSSALMGAGLFAAYGGLGLVGIRYLYPPSARKTAWVYVADLASFAIGTSRPFRTPAGERVTVARTGSNGDAADFAALSSTCPHLGCQVHWETAKQRFFCPCHNGTFDATGAATGGPPAEAKQSLPRYPLRVEKGLLYMEVALESLSTADGRG
ncbi:MAG: Rieske (2Fe-2S) protein [Polyangiaceae bacterium]